MDVKWHIVIDGHVFIASRSHANLAGSFLSLLFHGWKGYTTQISLGIIGPIR
jgi:hypothetical protein